MDIDLQWFWKENEDGSDQGAWPKDVIELLAYIVLEGREVLCYKELFLDFIDRIVALGPFFQVLQEVLEKRLCVNVSSIQQEQTTSEAFKSLGDQELCSSGKQLKDEDANIKTCASTPNDEYNNDTTISSKTCAQEGGLDALVTMLRQVVGLIHLCKSPQLLTYVLFENEELVQRLASIRFRMGDIVEALLQKIISKGDIVFREAIGGVLDTTIVAYQNLQSKSFLVDEDDKEMMDAICTLIERYKPGSQPYILSKDLHQQVDGFFESLILESSSPRNIVFDPLEKEFQMLCEAIMSTGSFYLDAEQSKTFESNPLNSTKVDRRKSATSVIWTRPQACVEKLPPHSPRVLLEVDSPTILCGGFIEKSLQETPEKEINEVPALEKENAPSSSQRQSYIARSRRVSRKSFGRGDDEPPWEFLCPISRELMSDPVIVATGQTYERNPIRKWIGEGHRNCPVTGLALNNIDLLPNYALRHAIERWASTRGITLAKPEIVPAPRSTGTTYVNPEWGGRLPDSDTVVMIAVKKLYCGTIEEQEAALAQLCSITSEGGEEGRYKTAEAGAVPPLVYQLDIGNMKAKELAARCIRFLCRSSNPMITQAAASAIPFLVKLLREGSMEAGEAAAGALVNLSAKTDVNKIAIVAAGAIPCLVTMLETNNGYVAAQEVAAAALCNLSINNDSRIQIATQGAIPLLVQVVKNCPTKEAGEYAAHALGSLACDNEENALIMVEVGAIPVLLAFAGSGTPWAQDAATRALRNLSFIPSIRKTLREEGAIQQLGSLVDSGTPRSAEAAVTALWNLSLDAQLAELPLPSTSSPLLISPSVESMSTNQLLSEDIGNVEPNHVAMNSPSQVLQLLDIESTEPIPLPIVDSISIESVPLPIGDSIPVESSPLPFPHSISIESIPLPLPDSMSIEPIPLPMTDSMPL